MPIRRRNTANGVSKARAAQGLFVKTPVFAAGTWTLTRSGIWTRRSSPRERGGRVLWPIGCIPAKSCSQWSRSKWPCGLHADVVRISLVLAWAYLTSYNTGLRVLAAFSHAGLAKMRLIYWVVYDSTLLLQRPHRHRLPLGGRERSSMACQTPAGRLNASCPNPHGRLR